MPWNGSGSGSRTNGTQTGTSLWTDNEAAANKFITGEKHDTHDQDLLTMILACLAKNGENAATGNLPMGGFKHTGVTAASGASSRTEYPSSGTVQDGGINIVSSVAGTDTITGTLTPAITAYVLGMVIRIVPANDNTGTTTINLNSVGAKTCYKPSASGPIVLAAGDLQDDVAVEFVYDTALNAAAGGWMMLTSPANLSKAALTDAANAFSAVNTFTADPIVRSSDSGAGVGPLLTLDRASSSPAGSDTLGALDFSGRDSGAGTDVYVRLFGIISDPTAASEDGVFGIATVIAGSLADRLYVQSGLRVGAPTGGDPGVGKINATEYQVNGTKLIRAGTDLVMNPFAVNTSQTQAHGLSVEPTMLKVVLECITTDGNWSVGNRVDFGSGFSYNVAASRGFALWYDTTNVYLITDATQVLVLLDKTTRSMYNITAANWKLIVTPYALAV